MRYLLEMIEVVKQKGIKRLSSLILKSDINADKAAVEQFYSAIEKCEVFVFAKTKEDTKPIPSDEEHNHTPNVDGSIDCPACSFNFKPGIDAPFAVFSYEAVGGVITSPRPGDTFSTLCVVVVEKAPKQYRYYVLMEGGNRNPLDKPAKGVFSFESDDELGTSFTVLTQTIFKRLEKERDGVEPVRVKVKLGSGATKRFHTIRRIIHVCPKAQVKEYEATGRKIDFSHRFTVRGHWRELGPGKLGKDRDGVYKEEGWTWVVDYTKGPKDKPVVHKTRFVHDDSEDT